MRKLTFPSLVLAVLGLTVPSHATPLTLPLTTLRTTVLTELSPANPDTVRLQLILLPSLTTSLTAVNGASKNGEAQTRILAPDQWSTGASFTIETDNPKAGRYFVGYRALTSDSSKPLTPYHILQSSGEPTALFYGDSAQEPIQMGFMRTGSNGGFGFLTLGAMNATEIQVTVRYAQADTSFLTVNLKTPPATCNRATTLNALMSAWTSSHTLGLLQEADGTAATRYTLIYELSDADLKQPHGLEFTVVDKFTGKILADGPMGTLDLPSVRQWLGQYDTRLTATSTPIAATRLGLAFLAFRGLAHADAPYPGFDFLQDVLHFKDYTQMTTVFNAALKTSGTGSPIDRLKVLYDSAQAVNQHPLQDPVSLVLKTPKDNVVFADGYTRMEFDTTFASSALSAWPGTANTRDLRLFILHSKNIALYTRDKSLGAYAFSPLLPAAADTLPAEMNPDTNAYALTLPITGKSLRALLKSGIYVRGNLQGIVKPDEAFHLSVRIIRDTSLSATPRL